MRTSAAVLFEPAQRAIFGLPVCDLDWRDALAFADAQASQPSGQKVISFLNAHNANVMLRDRAYRDALGRQTVLSDGIGVDLASKVMHGSSFSANLNATVFVPALLTYMAERKRIGLIGGRPEMLEKALKNLQAHAPWHEFIAISHGDCSDAENRDTAALAARLKLDVLIVGMGTPIQEKWVDRYIHREHARLVITDGALFEYVAGAAPRAPKVIRKLRLEWAYQSLTEPRRLGWRYILGVPAFLLHLLWHRLVGLPTRNADKAAGPSAPVSTPSERDRDRAA